MYQTIPQLFETIVEKYPSVAAQLGKDEKGVFQPVTYRQLHEEVYALAASLSLHGVKRGDRVGLISDNRKEWLASDLAILSLGAADVPRGQDAMSHEVEFILGITEAEFCFVENIAQLKKVASLLDRLPHLATIVVLDHKTTNEQIRDLSIESDVTVLLYSELVAEGRLLLQDPGRREAIREAIASGDAEETATIIFTSGTTGEPKGVMLSHRNFAYQLEAVPKLIKGLEPEQRWLSVLPIWHSFERILQYVIIANASTIAYSKPLGPVLLNDLAVVNPHWMGSVPRIWEAVRSGVYTSMKKTGGIKAALFFFFTGVAATYAKNRDLLLGRVATFKKRNRFIDISRSILPTLLLHPLYRLGNALVFSKIRAKLGTSFIAGVSGGGSLSESVDFFFDSIGVKLVDGYGLTESAPVISIRPLQKSIKRTMTGLPGTELRILDAEGRTVPPGKKGVLYVRGPQVMSGYFKRPELTKTVLSADGWLNTGDLAMWTHHGEFAIVGRAKDTIVLSGGENLEPMPIEARLAESEYIEQAVVLGQDRKHLGALIVLNKARVAEYLKEKNIPYLEETMTHLGEVKDLIGRTIGEMVSTKSGFKPFEQITRFTLLSKSFEVGKELSAKQELKRFEIDRMYEEEIEELFAG
ncbi:MAG: AMP-binding protein [Spirochaetales bacterium]|nr:AMP-binding protein [Spirochaetales bacterium]